MIRVKFSNNRSGYAILEVVFYILLFAVLSLAVINSLISMTRAFKEMSINRELMQGSSITEKIARDIRGAESIVSVGASSITINIKDENDVLHSYSYDLSGGNLEFSTDGVPVGNLNSTNTSINDISFTQITTGQGLAVSFSFSLSSSRDPGRIEYYYDTVVLRGSY